jgi:DNA-binding MarR family transcriptional regulator
MPDNLESPPSPDNIINLVHQLGMAFDERFMLFRRGTPYEAARKSDVRVFVQATRGPFTISEIARTMGITRQAVQNSVQRMQKMKVVNLQLVSGNRRDKQVVITELGLQAQNLAAQQVQRYEAEIAQAIGADNVEQFRKNLKSFVEITRAQNQGDLA